MSATTSTKQVKLTILIKKLDTLSTEEFHHYWRVEHPKAWLSVAIVKANVLKYSQVCIPLSCPILQSRQKASTFINTRCNNIVSC